MLNRNFLKAKLEAGQAVIGTWAVIPSLVTAEILAASGLDFVILDYEHGPVDFERAQAMIMACEGRGVSPCVRVGGVIPPEIARALDIGAHCVHVPNIDTPAELEEAIASAKYPPLGRRGFSPFTRAGGYDGANATRLTGVANEATLVCAHLEGQEAIAQLDRILALDGLDILFIGKYDLSKSLGYPGQVDHPVVRDHVAAITRETLAAGKCPGTIVTNDDQLKEVLDLGMRYVTYAVDCHVLLHAYRKLVQSFASMRPA